MVASVSAGAVPDRERRNSGYFDIIDPSPVTRNRRPLTRNVT
jgi:hypothetical protein